MPNKNTLFYNQDFYKQHQAENLSKIIAQYKISQVLKGGKRKGKILNRRLAE